MKKEDFRELVYTSDVTTLLQDGINKVLAGETTIEEILKLIVLDNDDIKKEDKTDINQAIHYSNMTSKKEEKPKTETKKIEEESDEKEVVTDKSQNDLDDFDINLDI